MRRLSVALALVLVAACAIADVVVLTNGDRVTGKVVGSVAKRVRLQTPYGVLVIPVERVDKIVRDDGTEQVPRLAAPTAPAPAAPGVLLVVSGASFWHAWDPKAAPEDPSLRLEIRLDDTIVASYTDVNLDPDDLPKAIVNSFVFSPERLFVSGGDGVSAVPPSLVDSEIRLEIRLPPRLAGSRQLRIAYQLNDAGSAAPRWRDVVVADLAVTLEAGRRLNVHVQQDRGTMEYGRKGLRALGQMRGVETFRATLEAQPAS